MAESTSERLTRLVALVTYLQANPRVPVENVAEHFGITPSQVLADINLLWVSGTPGYLPDDLIDFAADELDRDIVTLTNPRGMDRPLRLGVTEALALLVALGTLETSVEPGSAEHALLESAAAKLRDAAGAMAEAATSVTVEIPPAHEQATVAEVRRAIGSGRRLALRYVSAADVATEREVDPLQLLSDGSRWFLRAWCRRVDAVRHFRLDRILDVQVLETPAEAHDVPAPSAVVPRLSGADLEVHLVLTSRFRWVVEAIPGARVHDEPDGTVSARLQVVDRDWMLGLLLGVGEGLLRIEPPDLAQEAARRARDALEAYERVGSEA